LDAGGRDRPGETLETEGVDLIDGVSWAVAPVEDPPWAPLMHVPLVQRVREEVGVAVAANFGIETAGHAAEALDDRRLLYPAAYEHWLTGRVRWEPSAGRTTPAAAGP
jgi:hypothetical protein